MRNITCIQNCLCFLLLGSDVKALFPLSFQVNRWLIPFRLTAENLTNIAFLNATVYSHAPQQESVILLSSSQKEGVFFWGGGGCWGKGLFRSSSDGDDRMGAKIKIPKNPQGFQQNPKKFLDQKLTPQKSLSEFPSLENFQKT